ncbi:MAG: FadR family transcriptional regulator, partial [Mesorhizobium sp.]
MPDDKSRKRSAGTTASHPLVAVRRPEMAWNPGSSVHASLASEIGLRIVRGDYPPGTILP